jgi:hypothetical protein
MSNPDSDPSSDDPFSTSGTPIDESSGSSWAEDGPDPMTDDPMAGDPMADDLSSSVALDMARLWVQRHQKASMLGAFAVGVFVGAMLRE